MRSMWARSEINPIGQMKSGVWAEDKSTYRKIRHKVLNFEDIWTNFMKFNNLYLDKDHIVGNIYHRLLKRFHISRVYRIFLTD